ncbi:MAG: sulfate adenylyltransferase [Dehalococcoidia bacterium]|nr:sulfate adenylyltransferase [Dehalococcoidia bacterium]
MSPMEPHGGKLVNLFASDAHKHELAKKAQGLKHRVLNQRELSDLELLSIGGFSPLEGFMTQPDYKRVVSEMRLASGLPWSIPVTLSFSKEEAAAMKEGQEIALADESSKILAVMTIQQVYPYDKQDEAKNVYRTTEEAHPGVAAVYKQSEMLAGGKIQVLEEVPHAEHQAYRLTPAQTRAAFEQRAWKTIVGFQTRNPVHRAHEYIQKVALETVDGLLLHPLVGETKGDDIPADVRMKCYIALMEGYYPKDRALLSVLPAAMRYAGPREAIFHAIMRKNYGCTHFIVGRDHAGVGSYYGTYDAQKIFSEYKPGELGIQTMFFENTFFCKTCGSMASSKTCPHDATHQYSLSGTKMRQMLTEGQMLPVEISRPEVAKILIDNAKAQAAPK